MARITTEINDTTFEPLSEGPYTAKVSKLTPQPVKPGKQFPSIRVDMKILPTPDQVSKANETGVVPHVEFLSLAPQAGWKLEEFLKACGLSEGIDYDVTVIGDPAAKRKRIDFDTIVCEGRDCLVILSVGPERDSSGNPKPNGRLRNRVESWAALV